MTIYAIYENGVFRPIEAVALPDRCTVEVEVRQIVMQAAVEARAAHHLGGQLGRAGSWAEDSGSRGRSGRSSRICASRWNHRLSLPPVARPPTGACSCRFKTIATSFKRRIDELPVIDIHSL